MKILAPIREFDELEMLAASGAEELYCGIVPREWSARFPGALWLNRRAAPSSGMESFAELRRLRDAAHERNLPVFVTLNAPTYGPRQIDMVVDLAERMSGEAGADALIVTDLNLLAILAERKVAAQLHVSSVAAALNGEAVEFLKDFGVSRVVLPRSVTLPEIETIAARHRDIEIEVFLLNDGCAFEEGFCSTTHHHSVGAFCTNLSTMKADFEWYGPRYTSRRERWLRQNLTDYREWVWYVNGNGCGATAKGLPYGPCGLCAIPDLRRMGVASLKIVGREASPFRKMASVRMAADIVRRDRQGSSKLHTIERARALREEPAHCDSGYMCYYKVPPPC